MKTIEAKQMSFHQKFYKACVEVSTCTAFGGGTIL